MKNTKTKFLISAIALSLAFIVWNTVSASTASVYVSPATVSKNVGDVFDASIGVDASGNKVCVVEGTVVFKNLSCQKITLADDIIAQTSPTCENPNYLVGIPDCTTLDKALFTVSAKTVNAGDASISSANVDVIGEGVSIAFNLMNGDYAITAPTVPTVPKTNNNIKTSTVTAPKPAVKTVIIQPLQQQKEQTAEPTTKQTEPTSNAGNNLAANAGGASSNLIPFNSPWTPVALVVILGLAYGVYHFKKNRKVVNIKQPNLDKTK